MTDDLISIIDNAIDHSAAWGTGLTCTYFTDQQALGLVNIKEGDPASCWMAHDLGLALGAERIVWIMSGWRGDELTGQRIVVYLASNPTAYMVRPITITDHGRAIPAGDLESASPTGWLASLTDMLTEFPPKPDPETVRSHTEALTKMGAVVRI